MYTTLSFAKTDLAVLHRAIAEYSFATVVSGSDSYIEASQLPLLLDRTKGLNGTLIGHFARANDQWKSAAGQKVLAIFSGPHSYISPRWYAAPGTVPTWNYIAVHCRGSLEIVDEHDSLLKIVHDFVAYYESSLPEPWSIDARDDAVDSLLKQIVGFRIPIEQIEGKWKLNQNHPRERRERVIAALNERGDENSLAIARLMQATLDESRIV